MAAVLWGLAAGLLAVHLVSVALFLRRLDPMPRKAGLFGRPPITLIRPVCGRDAFDEETLGSSFGLDYPDYQIIFCVQRADDPVVPLLCRLMERHPHVRARLLIGDDRATGNPKLDNVLKGWTAAETEWVCMTDSNLLLPRNYLGTLIDSWRPETGMVSAPPFGSRPEGWAARLECAFLNGNQARLQYLADSLGQGFAQGKTLFFNKPLLDAAGGLALLGQRLAEDVAATRTVRALGRTVTLAPLPYPQPIGRRRLEDVISRQLRWSRVRRDGFPGIFLLEPLNGAVVPVASCLAAALMSELGLKLVLAYATIWYLAEATLIRRAGWPAGWKNIAVLPLRDLAMPVIWAATFLSRSFEWRGTAMGPAGQPEARGTSLPAVTAAE